MNELELVENKDLRVAKLDRIEVLDRVGGLILLPNVDVATTKQLANYFNVPLSTFKECYQNNLNELQSNGAKLVKGSELKELKTKTDFTSELNKVPSVIVFTRRAILNVAMLLRDSEVAQEIRKYLLDIEHDTSIESPNIIMNKLQELSEEKMLMLERVEAEMDGNWDRVCEVNARLFALKNKRIVELETTNNMITTNSLTIVESKAVINRVVRAIAMKEYGGMFGKAYGDLYSKLNYKLGINIKARDKKKSESYLDVLKEDEVFEVEKIVRNWAIDNRLDLDKLLKI